MDELTYRKHMKRPWQSSFCMKKYGHSIRENVVRATTIPLAHAATLAAKIKRQELAQGTLELMKHKSKGGTFQ